MSPMWDETGLRWSLFYSLVNYLVILYTIFVDYFLKFQNMGSCRGVARDKFSLSILAYWMGYALYCIWQCFANKLFSTGCVLHMLSKIQRPAMNKRIENKNVLSENMWEWRTRALSVQTTPRTKNTHFFVVFELEILLFICCNTSCVDSQKSFLLHCCQMI